jgi:hypothetical protein
MDVAQERFDIRGWRLWGRMSSERCSGDGWRTDILNEIVQPRVALETRAQTMKSASLIRTPSVESAQPVGNDLPSIRSATRKLTEFLQSQSQAFSAIALAEAGDSDGAIELLRQPANKKKS